MHWKGDHQIEISFVVTAAKKTLKFGDVLLVRKMSDIQAFGKKLPAISGVLLQFGADRLFQSEYPHRVFCVAEQKENPLRKRRRLERDILRA